MLLYIKVEQAKQTMGMDAVIFSANIFWVQIVSFLLLIFLILNIIFHFQLCNE